MPECPGDFQRIDSVAYPLAVVNVLIMLVNIAHIRILSAMPSLRAKSAYYHVLLHISLSDISYALSDVLHLVLNRRAYFQDFGIVQILLYDVFFTLNHPLRHLLLTMASLDRCFALCLPMHHSTSKLITKMHIWLPLCWILCLIITAVRNGICYKDLCFEDLSGPSVRYGVGSATIIISIQGLFMLVTSILTVRVLVELYKMKKRSLPQDRALVVRSVQYVVIIVAVFYAFLLPSFVTSVLRGYGTQNLNVFWGYYIFVRLCQSLYGFFNTFSYGWRTPAYRKQALVMLCCRRNAPSDEKTY